MGTLRAQDIADLTNLTLNNLEKGKIQNIAQNSVDYPMYRTIFLGDGKSSMSRWYNTDGGTLIQRQLMYKVSDSARHVGLYEPDIVNVEDVTTQLTCRWAMATTNWAFDEREFFHNKGEARIVNLMVPRRASAMLSLVEQIETYLWQAPGTSGDELKKPFGIPYWVVKGTAGQEGFEGGLPGSHTDVAGVNLTTVPTFKNYFADYTDVTKADLITKMRTAHRKCRFRSPVTINEHSMGPEANYKYYTTHDGVNAFENVGEAQNENLGRDIAPYELKTTDSGAILFRKHPICYVPELDSDTTDPVYGLDHSSFKAAVDKGWDLKEHPVKESPTSHNVFVQFLDLMYQLLCVDRRRQMVFAKV